MATVKPKFAYCVKHGRDVAIDKFNMSKNPHHASGYLPYCKDCIKKISDENETKMKSAEGACHATCGELGVPFLKEVWEQTINDAEARQLKPTFVLYYAKLNQLGRREWGGYYKTNSPFNEVNNITVKEEITRNDIRILELDWGKQTTEDYDFLIYKFDVLTKDIDEFESETQKDLFRKICLDELTLRQINEGRSTEDISKVESRILTKLKTLKLDDFEKTTKTLEEQWFFNMINQIETKNVGDIYNDMHKYEKTNQRAKAIDDMRRCFGNSLIGHRDFNITQEDIDRYNSND